jgi:hypothetical protein
LLGVLVVDETSESELYTVVAVGTKLKVKVFRVPVAGVYEQVALYGAEPEVVCEVHPLIAVPFSLNVNAPATLAVALNVAAVFTANAGTVNAETVGFNFPGVT